MNLTNANYYSLEANREFMSVSQLKSLLKCEAAAMAELRGEYTRPTTTALLVGSFVDAWFEGTLDQFQQEHPEIFKRDGSLKADYVQAARIIQRVGEDKLFMEYMSGEKQVIRTGEVYGVPFKIKMDSYFPGEKIVDLKCMRTMEPIMGKNFVEHWGYDIQGAIYREVEGNGLPFYLAVATKEEATDLEVLSVPHEHLNQVMWDLKPKIERAALVKSGKVKAERCGVCPYCRKTKVLTEPIDFEFAGLSNDEIKARKGEW